MSRILRASLVMSVIVAAAFVPALSAGADAPAVAQFPVAGSPPVTIAAGPDGALWFAQYDSRLVGRMTTAGVVTSQFSLPRQTDVAAVGEMTASGGALWLADCDTIWRIATDGTLTPFAISSGSCARGMTAGPDGNVWFTATSSTPDGVTTGSLGHVTPAGVVTEVPLDGVVAETITTGPDGALWFTEAGVGIGRITTDGTITSYPLPLSNAGCPRSITAGVDGALWFPLFCEGLIGRLTTDGVFTSFAASDPLRSAFGIASGQDGALWYVLNNGDVGRLTTDGSFTQMPVANTTGSGAATGIVAGPDGAVWFTGTTESFTSPDRTGFLGRIAATLPPGNASGTVTGGGTISTDPDSLGATPEVPVQTSITAPTDVSGTLTVVLQTLTTSDPTGFSLFGSEVVLTGPAATATSPYVVTFTIDSSLWDGLAPTDVQVFRNGAVLDACTDPTAAVPDPCVVSRVVDPSGSGDLFLTVRTSHFSTWNLGRVSYNLTGPFSPVAAAPSVNTAKAGSSIPVKFKLGGDKGLNVFVDGYPKTGAAPCGTGSIGSTQQPASAVPALTYDRKSAQYTYTWKTTSAMKGCRDLILRFRDGSELHALFNLR